MEASIRVATADDLPALEELEGALQKSPWKQAAFAAEMAKPFSRTLVITDDETDSRLYAYIVYWVREGEAEILTLGVAAEHRGVGLAKMLVQHVIAEALKAECKRLILDVRKSNAPALQLYQSSGFTVISVRKEFYSDGEDAYGMELPLQGDPLTPEGF